ncbi:MAG: hypothetical protein KF715_09470 [Candidatus Didemnitutus sp.]|nr:hypothetical protein [Candidatus Didemnitutus sp.]
MINNPVIIPNRFELLIEGDRIKAQPTLFPVEDDLRAIDFLINKANVQNGGVLAFLLGQTGVGKSTAAYSASVFLNDKVAQLIRVPLGIKLRDVVGWLASTLPPVSSKIQMVLFDGREITDDSVGLKQLLAGLNQLLRQRRDVLFLWPTTDPMWHKEIKAVAVTIGGSNFAPNESDIAIKGPSRADWPRILERILIQIDTSPADVALDIQLVADAANRRPTAGEFLSEIGNVIAQRTTNIRKTKALPAVLFAVTSGAEVVGEANRIRRAGTFILKAEELLAYSPRSESGKWWHARKSNPEHNLAYIISLFDSRLTTMTASSVAYACLHHGDPMLQTAATSAGMSKNSTNAETTMRATDLYRLLVGQTVSELTSSRKGKTKDTTASAYAAIQRLSAQNHQLINKAIVQGLGQQLGDVDFSATQFEVDGGDQNLYTDVVLHRTGSASMATFLEFHHISEANCSASGMAAYIMEKLRAYAIHYNLIPR